MKMKQDLHCVFGEKILFQMDQQHFLIHLKERMNIQRMKM